MSRAVYVLCVSRRERLTLFDSCVKVVSTVSTVVSEWLYS
jgi:hypothetical protein